MVLYSCYICFQWLFGTNEGDQVALAFHYTCFFCANKKVFYFSFSNIFLPNIKSCINCIQGNFIYITHFIQRLNSVVKKIPDKAERYDITLCNGYNAGH